VLAEAIHVAQQETGKKVINGEDMRYGLENIDLSEERLAELGLENFTSPIKGSCEDHEGAGSVFIQQWDGSDWSRTTDLIEPMNDVVRPLLEEAADKYVPSAAADIILDVNNIEVIYDHVILVLKGVSLQVPRGGIVAILGANGAGKTTTLSKRKKCITCRQMNWCAAVVYR